MKVYLDNCCYNRPYDDQENLPVSLEAQAKLYVQSLIKKKKLVLASSFILDYENSCNPYFDRKITVDEFLRCNVSDYIGSDCSEKVLDNAKRIMATGVKMKDSCHIACAEMMHCDYLLTTDKRMLKYKSVSIQLINPIDFLNLLNDNDNEY